MSTSFANEVLREIIAFTVLRVNEKDGTVTQLYGTLSAYLACPFAAARCIGVLNSLFLLAAETPSSIRTLTASLFPDKAAT